MNIRTVWFSHGVPHPRTRSMMMRAYANECTITQGSAGIMLTHQQSPESVVVVPMSNVAAIETVNDLKLAPPTEPAKKDRR